MTVERLGQTVYLTAFAVWILIRLPHARCNRRIPVVDDRRTVREVVLLAVSFTGMTVMPLASVFTPLLAFADYHPPGWAVGAGAAAAAPALWLFWRSHADLGRNWSPSLEVREGQALVADGVYRRIRHPMYASLGLWAAAQALLLPNWVGGSSNLLSLVPLYLLRVPAEERMMLDRFGEEYRGYMARAGRIFPRLAQPPAENSEALRP